MNSIVSTERLGDVFLRNFDEGIYRSLQYVLHSNRAYVPLSKVRGVDPPLFDETHKIKDEVGKPMPGIPIIMANPDDAVQRYNVPCFRITREDPSPALERWMSLNLKYRAPADGATEITVQIGGETITGYDKYEQQAGAWPYDIPYTVTCEGAGIQARTNAHIMLMHLMRAFHPHAVLTINDLAGEERKYEIFVEGPSELSQVSDIRDRTIIHAMSLRVSAELDLSDPKIVQAVTSPANVRTHQKE